MFGKPYEISENLILRKEFRRVFNLDFGDYIDGVLSFFVFDRLILDLFKFEDMLKRRFPKEIEDSSMCEIVRRHYGQEGVDLVERLL